MANRCDFYSDDEYRQAQAYEMQLFLEQRQQEEAELYEYEQEANDERKR